MTSMTKTIALAAALAAGLATAAIADDAAKDSVRNFGVYNSGPLYLAEAPARRAVEGARYTPTAPSVQWLWFNRASGANA